MQLLALPGLGAHLLAAASEPADVYRRTAGDADSREADSLIINARAAARALASAQNTTQSTAQGDLPEPVEVQPATVGGHSDQLRFDAGNLTKTSPRDEAII